MADEVCLEPQQSAAHSPDQGQSEAFTDPLWRLVSILETVQASSEASILEETTPSDKHSCSDSPSRFQGRISAALSSIDARIHEHCARIQQVEIKGLMDTLQGFCSRLYEEQAEKLADHLVMRLTSPHAPQISQDTFQDALKQPPPVAHDEFFRHMRRVAVLERCLGVSEESSTVEEFMASDLVPVSSQPDVAAGEGSANSPQRWNMGGESSVLRDITMRLKHVEKSFAEVIRNSRPICHVEEAKELDSIRSSHPLLPMTPPEAASVDSAEQLARPRSGILEKSPAGQQLEVNVIRSVSYVPAAEGCDNSVAVQHSPNSTNLSLPALGTPLALLVQQAQCQEARRKLMATQPPLANPTASPRTSLGPLQGPLLAEGSVQGVPNSWPASCSAAVAAVASVQPLAMPHTMSDGFSAEFRRVGVGGGGSASMPPGTAWRSTTVPRNHKVPPAPPRGSSPSFSWRASAAPNMIQAYANSHMQSPEKRPLSPTGVKFSPRQQTSHLRHSPQREISTIITPRQHTSRNFQSPQRDIPIGVAVACEQSPVQFHAPPRQVTCDVRRPTPVIAGSGVSGHRAATSQGAGIGVVPPVPPLLQTAVSIGESADSGP